MTEETLQSRLDLASRLAESQAAVLIEDLSIRVEAGQRKLTLPGLSAVALEARQCFGRVDILAKFENGESAWFSSWKEAKE